jgi:hypothetical protein
MRRLTHDEIIEKYDAPSKTEIVVAPPFIKMHVRYPNSSWFLLILDTVSGVVCLASDWGDYTYRWHVDATEPFEQFIFGRADAEYLAEKMMSKEQRLELDIEGTNKTIEDTLRGILDDDEDGEHTEDDLESDLAQLPDWSTEEDLLNMTFYLLEDHEISDLICEKATFRYAVFTKLIVPTFQRLWKEREERIARVAAEQAAHDALYPQHAKFREVDLESRVISEFMDFMDDKHYSDQHCPTTEMLIGEYFEIDVKEFDNEKDRMVAVLQAQAAKEKTP